MTHPSGAAAEPAFARADLLQLLAREFGSRGGDIGAVLDRRGIAPDTMIDADALVEASALYGAAEDMAAELGDIHFGAKVGKAAAAHGAHMLRGTAETARTLGDFFIGAILETDRRTNSVTYGLQVGPQAAVFEIHRRRETDPHPVQIDAGLLVFYTTMLSECLGLDFDASQLLAAATSLDGVPAGFLPRRSLARSDKATLSLSFPSKWLRRPMAIKWDLDAHSDAYASGESKRVASLDFIREFAGSQIHDETFDLDQLADKCGVSRRRLQRILAQHGTSFRDLRDAVRREAAIRLVTETRMPFSEVAGRVGLSSVSAFNKSYRRWLGMSPGAHRGQADG